jgi:hypothetical protein
MVGSRQAESDANVKEDLANHLAVEDAGVGLTSFGEGKDLVDDDAEMPACDGIEEGGESIGSRGLPKAGISGQSDAFAIQRAHIKMDGCAT